MQKFNHVNNKQNKQFAYIIHAKYTFLYVLYAFFITLLLI